MAPKTPFLSRSDFPADFKFGASSSALQTESSPHEGGRGSSTWDYFLGDLPAVQSYYKYKDDVQCLKNMNMENYRLSIAWPRLIPTGKLSDGVNQNGIDFYNNLINELVANGIEPYVTLFHFDLPSALQEEYNGLLSPNFVDDFTKYADLCFQTFGDRVKHWITINEPQVFAAHGYKMDLTVPDQPTKHPYMAAHHIILAHARTVKVYRENYRATQKGEIGISASAQWFIPLHATPDDKQASQRAWDFMTGWFLDPIVTGDYPFNMKAIVRDRLPTFTKEQEEMVKGSFDFIGINYYTSRYAKALKMSANDVPTSYETDQYVETLTEKNGVPIGEQAGGFDLIYVYPAGLGEVLLHLKVAYNNPKIYITENGYPGKRNDSIAIEEALQDHVRIEFLQDHLSNIKMALSEGVNIKGYFIWSLLDCMEMGSAYTIRFGLNYVDYNDDYKRYPKKSVTWLKNFITGNTCS
ncbi:beta-glucosidase 24-like isoform X1 [Actinidia eriantha]|uniref:beta-glucosidase 24-like isoform X1 n=1 Tax=Actinidia eriantha TaxID=165200 RepID=UPI00258F824C|nr:beta-glucosidase 24-like isoform X1 [Actinidia eriantha]